MSRRPLREAWRWAVMDSSLPPTTRCVLQTLANYMTLDRGSCHVSIERLREASGYGSDKTIRDALKLAERKGYLAITPGGGRGLANEYQAQIPGATNAVSDDRDQGNPVADDGNSVPRDGNPRTSYRPTRRTRKEQAQTVRYVSGFNEDGEWTYESGEIVNDEIPF